MNITFWGATDDVTGSMSILEYKNGKILIDAGLAQGDSTIEKLNFLDLPFNPHDIKAIILTHAHLDHSGYIPRLIKLGFRGNIYGTAATLKLAKIIMIDSANLQENDEISIMHGFYGMDEVNHAISLFKKVQLNEFLEIAGFQIKFQNAGHILGATSVIIKGEKTIIFSGDLGRSDDYLLSSPTPCYEKADYVVMESTYGNKLRSANYRNELITIIRDVKDNNNTLIIASFAIARGQMLLTLINDIFKDHPELKIPLYIDSPMMEEANKVYLSFAQDTKHPEEIYSALSKIDIIHGHKELESLKKRKEARIIISSSGMVSGGKILRILHSFQEHTDATIFLPGYQSKGTNGYLLASGQRKFSDTEGRRINWQGSIIQSNAFSSHADQSELLNWLKPIPDGTHVFLIHGEEESKSTLKNILSNKMTVTIPKRGDIVKLS